jgi:predicted nucleotidyltransferase
VNRSVVTEHYKGALPWMVDSTILLVKAGSQALGTNTPESDLDIDGICIPPKRYHLGYLHRFEQDAKHEPDVVIYDIRKYFQLAADCNPNVVQVMWVDPSDRLFCDGFGQELIQHRTEFLSRKAKHTFSGYAIAQLKRIRTHRKWLLNPPTDKPQRHAFGLPETTLISKDQRGAIEALSDEERVALSTNVMAVYEKERAYHNAMTEWNQYLNWRKTRNPKRAELEAKFGYDCKHAMHLVRLMRMCREILIQGEVIVKRPDREELLAIRNGAWEYDQLVEWADQQDVELTELANTSILPHSPDREALDRLCRRMIESHFSIAMDSRFD